jgi:RNA polymerase sigma-70 factor (ECF subfamily)
MTGALSMTAFAEAALTASGDSARGTSPDAVLLAGCRAGQRESFEELYRVHGPRMKSVAANVLGDRTEAEDAVQDAFVKIFRSAASFEGRSRFSTWIYRVVVNACHDRLRRRRETVSLDDPGRVGPPATPAERPADPALKVALERGIGALPPRQRSAFVLFAVEGFSHREIADILDVSVGNSKTLVFEAKHKLARLLQRRTKALEERP